MGQHLHAYETYDRKNINVKNYVIFYNSIRKLRGATPLAILRPSVIAAANEEPEPGWTESNAALHAVMIAMALGQLDLFPFDQKCALDTVPVDFVAASILEVSCYLALNTKRHCLAGADDYYQDVRPKTGQVLPLVPIFHLSSSLNPLQWLTIIGGIESYFNVSPLKRSLSSRISVRAVDRVEDAKSHISKLREMYNNEKNPIEKKKLAAQISTLHKFHFFIAK